MESEDSNLQKLRYATEWQIEIGKVLQAYDPVLRPVEDMAKHGITMATVLLGISASIVGAVGAGSSGTSYSYLLILGAWLGFVVAAAAGSVQLNRIAGFRESIRSFCHILLGKPSSLADFQSFEDAMKIPQKSALSVEYWALGIATALLAIWAVTQTVARITCDA